MSEYHKIQTVYHRNPETNHRTLINGAWSHPAFEYLANNDWLCTEKVDGTNIRVMWDGSSITFAGRTDRAEIPKYLLNRLREVFSGKYGVFLDVFGEESAIIYGEGYGNKIQKAGSNYISDGCDFVAFDVYRNGVWWSRDAVCAVCERIGIDLVPLSFVGDIMTAIEFVREGFTSEWGDFKAEGLVLRPSVEMLDNRGNRIITKVKTKDFAIKEEQ